jgi:predicted nuclease of restriction endonuclease-like (RecB) superfamily
MSQRQAKPAKSTAPLPTDYAPLLADIKARVQSARIKAGLAANRELLALYWDIGRLILDRQQREGWGAKVIDRLAVDLQRAFPQMTGFSRTNLLYMRAFAEAWRELAIVQLPVAQLTKAKRSPAVTGSSTASAEIVQQPVGQLAESIVQPSGAQFPTLPPEPLISLPWGHNVMLLDKLTSPADRIWYAAKAVEHGWSRNVLALQIEAGLHRRQGKAVTNFKTTLPPAQSDLAQGITKDPYLFDFLTLRDDANERAVEAGLVAHVEKFLLELGAGFALVGRQVPLEVGDQDFYLDLLFYHLKLRCYVVIDLLCGRPHNKSSVADFVMLPCQGKFLDCGESKVWRRHIRRDYRLRRNSIKSLSSRHFTRGVVRLTSQRANALAFISKSTSA